MKTLHQIGLIGGFVACLFAPGTLLAGTITATELIVDAQPFELFGRNLERTRSNTEGFIEFENDGPTIVAENGVSNSFGIWFVTDVWWEHKIDWYVPPPASFATFSLTIKAFGNQGGDEIVFVDSVELGALESGNFFQFLIFTETVFTNNDPLEISGFLDDETLSVFVEKNTVPGLGQLDFSSIYSSQLDVTYVPVPEPGSLLLLGAGLGALSLGRRKRS